MAATAPTILFLEQDQRLIDTLGKALREIGFSYQSAHDFTAAQTLIQQHAPQLIILNIELTPENGYALFKKLKREKATAAIPCLITSAAATADEDFKKHRAIQTPAQGYLKKPYELFDFLDLLSTLIEFPEPAALQPEPIVKVVAAPPTVQAASGDWAERENELNEKHKKAQNTLREFYREKLEKMQADLDAMQPLQQQLEEFRSNIDSLQQEVQAALDAKTKAEQMLDKERSIRKRVSDALKD